MRAVPGLLASTCERCLCYDFDQTPLCALALKDGIRPTVPQPVLGRRPDGERSSARARLGAGSRPSRS